MNKKSTLLLIFSISFFTCQSNHAFFNRKTPATKNEEAELLGRIACSDTPLADAYAAKRNEGKAIAVDSKNPMTRKRSALIGEYLRACLRYKGKDYPARIEVRASLCKLAFEELYYKTFDEETWGQLCDQWRQKREASGDK